jgi:hypothetical protein
MSNSLDLLLKLNPEQMSRPSKKIEMKRLSQVLGEKVIFTCQAIYSDKFAEIQEQAVKIGNGQIENIDTGEIQTFTVLEGVKEPNLKSKELREKFNCPTPKELVKNLLLPGELTQLYNIISDLSGFGSNTVEEIKN